MSTEDIQRRDGVAPTPSAPPAPPADEPVVVDAAPTGALTNGAANAPKPIPSAGSPAPFAEPVRQALTEPAPSGDQTVLPEGDTLRRRIQLRSALASGDARAIPSLGNATALAGESGPVQLPAIRDAEVDVEVSRVVVGLSGQDMQTEPATESKEPVALPGQESIDASLEAAVEAALSGTAPPTGASAATAPALDVESLQTGQKLQGTVQAIHEDSVFLDFGLRLTGVAPFRQFSVKKPPQLGDAIEVVVDKVDDTEGLILTNLPRGTAKVQGNWDAVAPEQVVECVVTKTNKGGLEVSISSLRGFIPASQVELSYVADLQQYVGQKLRARITEVNPAKRKLVLSRRALLAEERELAKQELLGEIKPDQVRSGRVKTIKEYGAFVDLGGLDGFLPVAQMSWVRIEHPSEVISEGQQIEVKVLSVDREKNRISLGMRQLAPNPWRQAEAKYAKGTHVTGRVTRVETFGAFVELEPGVEGLVHISELDHRRVRSVTEVLNVGDMAEVQVLDVDPKKKRIGLSVKALKAKPEPVERPKDEDLAPGKGQQHKRQRKEPLKGGTGSPKRGGLFGNPRDFGS